MYAIGHTSHTLISLSETAEAAVRRRQSAMKKKARRVFYRTAIKHEVWSFFETREQAVGFETMLFLNSSQS